MTIDVAPDGRIAMAHDFRGTVSFETATGPREIVGEGGEDVFLMRLDDDEPQWVVSFGSTDDDEPADVALAEDGAVVAIGTFGRTVDFDPGPGVEERTVADVDEMFIVCFEEDGTFRWVVTLPTNPSGVAIRSAASALVVGSFGGTVDFDPGPDVAEPPRGAFVVSYALETGAFEWVQTLTGDGYRDFSSVAADGDGSIVLGGMFSNTADFDLGPGVDERTAENGDDGFVLSLGPSGDHRWVATVGSNLEDLVSGVSVCPSGAVVSTGYTMLTADFDPGPGEVLHDVESHVSPFLWRLSGEGALEWAISYDPYVEEAVLHVECAQDGSVAAGGRFEYTVDFDPGPGLDERTPVGEFDAFLTRVLPGGTYER